MPGHVGGPGPLPLFFLPSPRPLVPQPLPPVPQALLGSPSLGPMPQTPISRPGRCLRTLGSLGAC